MLGMFGIVKLAEDGELERLKERLFDLEHHSSCMDDDLVNYLNSAAWAAAGNGHLKVVGYLFNNGASTVSYTSLIAAKYNHLEVVKYMISIGANTMNIMDCAIINGSFSVIRYLISVGPVYKYLTQLKELFNTEQLPESADQIVCMLDMCTVEKE